MDAMATMQGTESSDRLLETLEKLLEIPSAELDTALTRACNALADALHADKVDAFLYNESKHTLVALGTSTQPLSNLQKTMGLDVLPIANGGRAVHVFQTGRTFVTGRLDEDPEELRGVKLGLKIKVEGRRPARGRWSPPGDDDDRIPEGDGEDGAAR